VEEIELRRYFEHAAAQRRALPDGGEVAHDFEVVSETGPIHFSTDLTFPRVISGLPVSRE
jgi:predicted dithiol-disulfide oxidoreductase (DUF899 family)